MIRQLFDLEHTLAKSYLESFSYPWEALGGIGALLEQLGPQLQDYREVTPGVWVHPTAQLASGAVVEGPCVIGPGTELRQGAYIRGNVLVGGGCVVGNSTELKNAILFDGVQAPHFNYVGDSILGHKAHLGAGVICSNVRGDKQPVTVGGIATGRKKVGAMVGDHGEIGCHTVLNPGSVIGRGTRVYPVSSVRGIVPGGCIFKNDGTVVPIRYEIGI